MTFVPLGIVWPPLMLAYPRQDLVLSWVVPSGVAPLDRCRCEDLSLPPFFLFFLFFFYTQDYATEILPLSHLIEK